MASKNLARKIKRHVHIRRRVVGTGDIPRLTVFKSNKYIYGQIIDDSKNVTLAGASSSTIKGDSKSKIDLAFAIGEKLAQMAAAKKVKRVVFDRSGYRYHGIVKALAEGARKGGLNF